MAPFRFSNRTVAVAIGVFAAGYLGLAFDLPDFTAVDVPVQPATLPRWLGVVLLALAALLFFQRTSPGEDGGPTGRAGSTGDAPGAGATAASDEAVEHATGAHLGRLADGRLELALFAASIAVYIALLEPVGFLISTTIYVGAVTAYLGYRRHWVTGVLSIGVAAGLYFLMSGFLNVALPSGPLPF